MAHCHYCQSPVQSDAARCPQCGRDLTAPAGASAPGAEAADPSQAPGWKAAPPSQGAPAGQAAPPPPGSAQWQAQASAAAQQASAAAQQAWVKIQAAGPAKVGAGLMAASALFWVWRSQRGIWNASVRELLVAVLVIGYLCLRELRGQDLLPRHWWAPLAASAYMLFWAISGLQLKLGSLVLLAGAGLLAYTYFWPLRDWARSMGFDWRYGLYGYRRPVALGAILAFLSLFLTWIPESRTYGYWSGGYSYSSYSGGYVWDSTKWYNPGFSFPSWEGYQLTGSVLMQAALLACLGYAMLAPQFAAPKWYRHIPFLAAGYGLVLMIYTGYAYIGQLVCLIGLGLIAWGGYQLSVKDVAEGKGDLREIPLNQWLSRWL